MKSRRRTLRASVSAQRQTGALKHPMRKRSRLTDLLYAGFEILESRLLLSVDVTTAHYGITNSGVNSQESILTPANVNTTSFGQLFNTPVDGQVYAETLEVNGVTIQSGSNTNAGAAGVHDTVYVATEADSLYAIDAHTGAILWYRKFANAANPAGDVNNTLGATAITAIPSSAVGSTDITPSIGITGTPVIDTSTNTLYVIAQTDEVVGGKTTYVYRLHAISLSTGTDVVSPFMIGSTSNGVNNTPIYVYGTGYNYGTGSDGVVDPYNGTGKTVVQFNSFGQNQRAGLSLVNGTVYAEWSDHGLLDPYHGWVVSWNVSNLQTNGIVLSGVLCTTPNNGRGGVWVGATPMAFEPDGSAFYFSVGNGNAPTPTIGSDGFPTNANYSEGVVKAELDPTTSPAHQSANGWGIKIVDYFLPFDSANLDTNDTDLGSGGITILPASAGIPGHPDLLIAGGKSGKLYLLDRDNLGHYQPFSDAALDSVPNGQGKTTPPLLFNGLIGGSTAYFNGQIYALAGFGGAVQSYSINSNGQLTFASQTLETNFGYIPGSPVISADGTNNAILWVDDRTNNELHALDPSNLSIEYWNSNQAPGGLDALGAASKYDVPTVANGQVFIGTSTGLVAYGLKAPAKAAPLAPVLTHATSLSNAAISLNWSDATALPNTATNYLIQYSTNGTDFTQIASAAAASTSITIAGLNPATTYYFQIIGVNPFGESSPSNVLSAATTGSNAAIDFGSGFGSNAPELLTLSGSAQLSGGDLYLTNNQPNQAASVWSATQLNIAQFSTQFDFQMTGTWPLASGFTFAIQRDLPNAVGPGGSGLGYGAASAGGVGGIPSSLAIKFAYDTGLFTNGAALLGNTLDLVDNGINILTSYDPMHASMTYNGTTLTVVITDLTTHAVATQSYAINIPAILGGSSAWVGFTGGTGAQFSNEIIQTWQLTSNASTPPITSPSAPSGLGSGVLTSSTASLAWIANSSNQTGYYLDRSTNAAFTQNLVTQTLPATPAQFVDTGLTAGASYFYRIRAFNSAGASNNSNVVKVTLLAAVPAPTTAPLNFAATPTVGGVNLQWDALTGATAYTISYGTTSGGPYPNVISGLSGTTYSLSGLSAASTYYFVIAAANSGGTGPNSAPMSATPIVAAPTGLNAAPGNGNVQLTWNPSSGATQYEVSRATVSGGSYSLVADNITSSSYDDTSVINGTPYYYVVAAEGVSGAGPNSAEISATPNSSAVTLDFSGGFASAAGQLALNGSARLTSGNILLANNNTSEAGSAYALTQQNVAAFTTQFDFQIDGTWPLGDGMTFVIQRAGLTALGTSGGGLGYGSAATGTSGGIANSLAIKFDVYSNQGEGTDSTGLYENGAAPTNIGAIDLSSTGFNMRSYDPSRATLTYDGTTLTVVLKDLVNGETATQQYAVNIPAVVGGSTAWVGFTAGTGSITSNDAILNWTYTTTGGSTTPTPPAMPSGLNATPGNGQVALAWTAVPGANSYNIKYGTASGVYNASTSSATNSATISGLANGTPYFFVVTAVNTAGESGNSTQVSATPAAPVPPAVPTGLNATPSNGQVALTWNAVAGANSYTLSYGTSSGVYSNTVPAINTNSFTLTGLTNGTPYFFAVSASNSAGPSNNSVEASATPLAPVPPAAPTGLSATGGSGQITLAWNAVSGAASYTVKYGTSSGNYTVSIPAITAANFVVTGLANGTPYYFIVLASNAAGPGGNSAQATATPTAPAAPAVSLDFSGGFSGNAGKLKLNGATAIAGNDLALTNNGTSEISSAYALDQQNISFFTTQFDFQITGNWPLGDGFTFVIQRAGLTAIGQGGGGLGYGATASGGTGGIPNSIAIKFDVYSNQGEGTNSTGLYENGAAPTNVGAVDLGLGGFNLRSYDPSRATMSYDGTTLTVVLKDLVTGATATQQYAVNIPAVIGGTSAWVGFTAASGALTSNEHILNWTFSGAPASPPAIPGELQATPGDGQVALSWNPVAGATSYTVSYGTASGSYTTTVPAGSGTSVTVPGLANGTPYYFVVAAANGAGPSGNSSEISATPVAPAPPGTPTGFAAAPGDGQITLSWIPVTGATSYTIQYGTTSGTYTSTLSNLTGSSFTLNDLSDGTPYFFVISASNDGGTSTPSSEISATPSAALPAAPGDLTATAGNGQIALAWNPVPGASYYTIRFGTTSGVYSLIIPAQITATSYALSNMTNGTTYYIEVTASNSAGEGPASFVSATPNAAITTINYAAGFAGSSGQLALNGNARVLSNGLLSLTDNNTSEDTSVYFAQQQNISTFSTQFDFQTTGSWPLGDGFTFVIQRAGATALGQAGGGLGYGAASSGGTGGIPNSVAIKFDVFSNQGEGTNSTGLYVNGAAPTSAGSINLDPTGFNLRSYDNSSAVITYDGTTLTGTLSELVTGATATQHYTVNIPALIGGGTAWVGFTAASGSQISNQQILNWTYTTTG